jgi:serine protease
MAPGGDVDRDDNGDGNPDGVLSMVRGGYAYYNGTSMATPHVAGVLALWLARDPTLTPAGLLAKLEASAMPRSAAACPRPCGAGLLNATGVAAPALVQVSVRLDPDKRLDVGEQTSAVATVTLNGVPEAGRTVSFSSSDPGIATVAPATALSDASGLARTTVTGVSRGRATITAEVDGARATTRVRVPDLTVIGLALLVLLVLAASAWRRRPARAGS